MAYLGIIFDFNGVLWWDSQLQEQAWGEFASEQFGVSLTDEIMAAEVHGRNNKHSLEFLAGTALDDQQVEQLSNQKENLYRALCLEQGEYFKLSPGAVDLLDWLTAKGISLTIATASGIENITFFIEHLQLERWFDPELILFDDGVRPGKPAPNIFLQAAKMIGLKPGNCVVVEDSMSGIQAAQSAGIGHIIALKSGDKNPSSSKTNGADLIIENLAQIPREELFNNSGSEAPAKQNGAVDDDERYE